jgi:SSS family solute:Na+ symporter
MSLNLWQAWWAWLVCFVVTVVVSLFTTPKKDEELVGLVKGLTKVAGAARVPLLRRPAFWAGLSLLAVIGLNIWLW